MVSCTPREGPGLPSPRLPVCVCGQLITLYPRITVLDTDTLHTEAPVPAEPSGGRDPALVVTAPVSCLRIRLCPRESYSELTFIFQGSRLTTENGLTFACPYNLNDLR